jgi:hypothetical protein
MLAVGRGDTADLGTNVCCYALLPVLHRTRPHGENPLTRVFPARELRELDAHLERIALAELALRARRLALST